MFSEDKLLTTELHTLMSNLELKSGYEYPGTSFQILLNTIRSNILPKMGKRKTKQ